MTTQSKHTTSIIRLLTAVKASYPDIEFVESGQFSWHAGSRHVNYRQTADDDTHGAWALTHELGHALLDHTDYTTDLELLKIEVAAWQKAHELAKSYGFDIDEEYVQDALDSYRDWLHLRSTCPTCYERCLQQDRLTYRCHNCDTSWHVTRSRLCRPYRKTRNRS